MENILAIDVGGSSIKYGLLSKEGDILFTSKTEGIEIDDITVFTNDIINLIKKLQEEHEFIGIAFSTPGVPNEETLNIGGISAIPCLHTEGWLQKVKDEIGLPISLANDGNCSLLAELWLGKAQGLENAIGVAIGSGIGGAIYSHGKLNTGTELCGGEFGYLLSKTPEGEIVNLSSRIATSALVYRVNQVYEVKNGEEVFKLFDQGVETVVEAVNSYFDDLALFIYNLHYAFEPDIILLGGGISARADLIPLIEERFHRFGKQVGQDFIKFRVDTCKFSNDSNLIGAVYNFIINNK